MADPTLTKILDTISVITNEVLLGDIVNQIIDTNYTCRKLLKNSEPVDGGTKMEVLLEYGDDRPRWMGEWDKVQYNVREYATAALFDWKNLMDNIVFSEMDLKVKNTGKARILSLAKIGSRNLVKTFKRGFGDMIFANRARLENEPYNLYDIIVNNTGELAGINPSDSKYAWWKANKLAIPGTVTLADLRDPQSEYFIQKVIGYMYDELSTDDEYPDLIVTTQNTWREYEHSLAHQKVLEDRKRANGSFMVLLFENGEITKDRRVPAGHMYFLNTKYIKFRHHKDFKFVLGDWQKVTTGEKAYALPLDWYGALTCSNRAFQGVITGIPETSISISGPTKL